MSQRTSETIDVERVVERLERVMSLSGYKTQKEIVIEHLNSGKTISQWEAFEKYQIRNLSSVISRLSNEGWKIQREIRRAKTGSEYVVWSLGNGRKHATPPSKDASPSLFEDGDQKLAAVRADDTLAEIRTTRDDKGPDTPDQSGKASGENAEEILSNEGFDFGQLTKRVATFEEQEKILDAFKAHCEKTQGRRVVIEPEMAREVLKINWKKNRTLSISYVKKLSFEMQTNWKYINAQIAIDEYGRLTDGQHRLAACVFSGVPFITDVAIGIDGDGYLVIDRNRVKSPGDIASYEGVQKNRNTHAAAAAILFRYDAGYDSSADLTSKERQESITMYPALSYWVEKAKTMTYNKKSGIGLRGPTGLTAAILYLCARIDPNQAEAFSQELKTGENLGIKDAPLVARLRINAADSSYFCGNSGYPRFRTILSRAWNYRRIGKSVSTIKIFEGSCAWPEDTKRTIHEHEWPEDERSLLPSAKKHQSKSITRP